MGSIELYLTHSRYSVNGNCQFQNILEKASHLGLFTCSSWPTCSHVLALTRPSSEDILSTLLPHSWFFTVVWAPEREGTSSKKPPRLSPVPWVLAEQVSVLCDTYRAGSRGSEEQGASLCHVALAFRAQSTPQQGRRGSCR